MALGLPGLGIGEREWLIGRIEARAARRDQDTIHSMRLLRGKMIVSLDLTAFQPINAAPPTTSMLCPACGGRGRLGGKHCYVCRGTGSISKRVNR